MMQKYFIKGLANDETPTVVRVYDVSKQELIHQFESMTKACEFLMIDKRTIARYAKQKKRYYSLKLLKTICFRTGKN